MSVDSSRLTVKRITGAQQKAQLNALQLLCLPEDLPIPCSYNGCSFAVYDKRRMVAFGLAKPSDRYQRTLYLSRAGVDPRYRGLGLQRQLIALREEWALKYGFEHVITDTANTSVASMRSLMAAGYKPFWPHKVKPWALPRSVYWKKQIND